MASTAAGWGEHVLQSLFGSGARARILALLLQAPEREVHARAVARELRLPYTAVARELKRLLDLGLLACRSLGRTRLYRPVNGHPLVAALGQVVEYAVGAVPRLQEALAEEEVALAFVFGSVAAGDDSALSDVDLFVVGEIAPPRLAELVRGVAKQTQREINSISYRPDEFEVACREPSAFLTEVLERPRIFLVGDEHALRELTA